MTTVAVTEVSGTALYHRYPSQTSPQPAYVALACETGALTAETDPEIGGAVPFRVWHGHEIRWAIPALKADAANELLAAIEPLAQRVCDGYASVWDDHNHVAELDDDAREACDAIEALCERAGDDESDTLSIWEACDWYGPLCSRDSQRAQLGITAATTDAELAAIVAREETTASADTDGVDGLEEYLADLRAEAIGALVEAVGAESAWLADDDTEFYVRTRVAAGDPCDARALAAAYDRSVTAWSEDPTDATYADWLAARLALASEVDRAYRTANGSRPDAWTTARVAAWVTAQAAEDGDEISATAWADALEHDAHHAPAPFAVGDRVEGGAGEDHDTGRVVRVEGDAVTVAWDQGVTTTQPAGGLHLEGARPRAAGAA